MANAFPHPIIERDEQLLPAQKSFTRGQSHRLRSFDIEIYDKPSHFPLSRNELPLLNQQKHKTGLLGFFSRNKPAKPPDEPHKQESSRVSGESPRKLQTRRESKQLEQTCNTFHPLQSPSLDQRSNPAPITLPRRISKNRLTARLDKKDSSTKLLASWDPPELFKAYPQAVKHSRLRAPLLQAEMILQIHDEKKRGSLDHDGAQDDLDISKSSSITDGFRGKRDRNRKSKSVDSQIPCDKWTEKVYVLATSGYLLQYAGFGNFDRLPDKVMRLGKESAAFASDAIVGEYYVLQVSRSVNEEGVVSTETSKSVFKKFGLSSEPKSASSFLLVFDTPDDMDAWLIAVKKEIEALGGRKYRPDVLVRRATDDSKQIRERPSRRFMIMRDPNRFTEKVPDRNVDTTDSHERPTIGKMEDIPITLRRPSLATQISGDSPSLSNGTTSTDQAYLEGLRGTPRLSYISSATKTLSTSRTSSPDPSPARAAFSPDDLIPQPTDSPTPTMVMSQNQRLSKQTTSASSVPTTHGANDRQELGLPRALSLYGPSTLQKSFSPHSNFNVPSFSKRYSCATNINLSTKTSISMEPSHHFGSSSSTTDHEPIKHRNKNSEERALPITSNLKILRTAADENFKVENIKNVRASLPDADAAVSYSQPHKLTDCHYSSLEGSEGNLNNHLMSNQSPSPHPPPTTALPALPKAQTRDHGHGRISAHCSHHKAQRPNSLQVHSDPGKNEKHCAPLDESKAISRQNERLSPSLLTALPKPRRAPPPPPIPILRSNVHNRKSMPQISHHTQSKVLPDFSLLPEVSFLLDPESSAKGSFTESWISSEIGRGI